jgi:hypothetical protein
MTRIDRRVTLLLALALGLSAPAVRADPTGPAIMAFVNKPEHRQAASATAVEAFKTLQECDKGSAESVEPPEFYGSFGPLSVDANGNLSSGLLKEAITVSGCGKRKVENILTLSDKGQLKSIVGLPGTSHADPLLAKDSMRYAYMGALRKIGQCKEVRVIDTLFDDFEGPPNPRAKFQKNGGRPWRETWTLNACGMLVDTDIHYVPDETGTTIQTIVPPVK